MSKYKTYHQRAVKRVEMIVKAQIQCISREDSVQWRIVVRCYLKQVHCPKRPTHTWARLKPTLQPASGPPLQV